LAGPKSVLEEIHQGRSLRHLRQPRVVAHQHVLARVLGEQRRTVGNARITVGEVEQTRLDDDRIELAHHLVLEGIGAFGQAHRVVQFPVLSD
jgi:hypothetical protein